ncbi:hypothetical protein BT93_E1181 [Corymbia citriodora subsp. variegata]|nr:hypothetical protein BT93_E1181 [Corymbia citriodora subsp. variegata]
MELAQMMECNKADNRSIVPIFYDINPAELKYPSEPVKDSFCKHEKRGVDPGDIAKWKQALRDVAAVKGHDLPNGYNGHQGELIKKVVSDVLQFLKKNDLVVSDSLVGIEPHVQEVMKKLGIIYVNGQATEICDKDVHVLKICGMPGVGKTTLAKFVYNKIHHLFQGCSFLEIPKNVESNGLMRLQKNLISDLRKRERRRLSTPDEGTKVIADSFKKMRVLIFIDDVHHFNQIKCLVGNLSWFGPGSRILMTVGRKDILDDYPSEVADEYEVELMKRHQALQLFHKYAFDKYPLEEQYEYDSLSIEIVDIIEGLPLVIQLTASYLHNKEGEIEIWRGTLDRLKSNPKNEVKEVFKLSYDSLDEDTKNIFLDIACFFIGMDKRIPSCMWQACGYNPSIGIRFLCDMCLIKIGENHELWMHNQLREFGKDIVTRKDHQLWKRSRLWDYTGALSVLNTKESAENVEALALMFDEGQSECFRCEGFGHPWSLRFLRLDKATIGGSFQNALSNLRWLDWQGCSKISELLILHLENLVILDLSRSLVTGDSQVWGQILEKAKKLEVLKLSGCRHLHASPDFHTSKYLKRLVLEHCSLLSQIGRSLGHLENLVSLNLKFCKFVKDLPEELCYMKVLEELLIDGTSIRMIHFLRPASMERLQILSACQCESLARISDSIGQLKSLTYLGLDGAAIDSLPDSIGSLKKLQSLLLGNCQKLPELPYSIGNLESLEIMDLSSTMIARLPRSIENLKKLKVLKMENTHLRKFPKDIKNLDKLEEIDLSRCKNLKGQICFDFRGLSSLKILRLSSTKTSGLPWSDDRFSGRQTFSSLSHLHRLDLSECDQVRALPKLPPNLSKLKLLQLLEISHCSVQTLDGLENMPRLRKLSLFNCPSLTELPDPTKYNFEIDMLNY